MTTEQKPFSYINTNEHLEGFCNRLSLETLITVDTEFIRRSTYFPKLATIQIATPKEAVVIDAIAPSLNLGLLKDAFFNEKILKVFHAGRQDLEIFYQLWNAVPTPIADTQVMGMVGGFGDSVSYESLAKNLINQKLNKSCRDSNWMQRPLSKEQLRYAADDAIYLLEIYRKLYTRIEDRLTWINEEMAILENPATYKPDFENAWRRLKLPSPVSPEIFSRIAVLAAWREQEAVRLDKPRHHILQDPHIMEIAQGKSPHNKIKSLIDKKPGKKVYESVLLKCIEDAKSYDKVPKDLNKLPPALSASQCAILEILKIYYRLATNESLVAQKLVCSSSDLKDLVRSKNPNLSILQGWRYDIFGKMALDFLEGRTILKVVDGRLKSITPPDKD